MKENLVKDIRKYAIPARQKIDVELEGMTQVLARAADRIEKYENVLKHIAKHGYPFDKIAKETLKNP
jgi:hypothetical protein